MNQVVYREVFRSPFMKDTESEALEVLDKIREAHPSIYGWEEVRGYVEQLSNGKFQAVREHVKYS